MRLFIIGGMLVLFPILFITNVNQSRDTAHAQDVYSICEQSRLSATIDEQQCAAIQESTGFEYLCANNNNLSNNHCWVEKD